MQWQRWRFVFSLIALTGAVACSSDDATGPREVAKDPLTAPRVPIDRFSPTAGKLFVRSATNPLPGPNQPIDMDTGPFITLGLGPEGEHIKYYNFDVQSTTPAPIFVLYREGETTPVRDQLNIVDVIPGQQGYNDFWQVLKVTVPANYVANTVTSLDEIRAKGYAIEPTTTIVNCPIVPEGSIARLRLQGGASTLTHGWYRDQVVAYFNFDEAPIEALPAGGGVPLAVILVSFTINPDQPLGGPASGFKTEPQSQQTHNVADRLPGQNGYSPLWSVVPWNNASFDTVHDLESATLAPSYPAAGNVNCPIVSVQP
jgi:hypothetical protein